MGDGSGAAATQFSLDTLRSGGFSGNPSEDGVSGE